MDLVAALKRRLERGVADRQTADALLTVVREAARQAFPDPPRPPDAAPAADLVAAFMAALPEPVAWPEDLAAIWPRTVGQHLAEHSRPVGVSRGVLVVQVDHPGVRWELSQLGTERIAARVRAELDLDRQSLRRVRLELR